MQEPYTLRKATLADAALLFGWANEPLVREMSVNSAEIKWEEHLLWLAKKTNSLNSLLYILEKDGMPVGQIRYDLVENEWTIDYSIDKEFRNKGIGRILLSLSLPLLKDKKVTALVKKENLPSQTIFINLGFKMEDVKKINGQDYFMYTIQL
ncbi:MAG TPA: GNAT family N-acetyltransferase [Chitinophagales bacterium]|nr:GNAT family N-acetyltransferase [Chitinophagales bacterium]